MLTRIITALIALVVFFAVIFLNNVVVFGIALAAAILLMVYEGVNVLTDKKSVKIVSMLSSALLIWGFFANSYIPVLCAVIAVFMMLLVVMHEKINCKEIFAAAFMSIYIVLFMSFIFKLKAVYGVYEMLLVFVCAWLSDTGAYFVGTFMGKHKLMPKVSPKKTIEGAVGGVVVCILSCMLYLFIVRCLGGDLSGIGYANIALIGLVTSVLAQLGDLAASAIKRDVNVKDYGNIFPGHGGFMDRFDSVMFIAPLVYYFITLIR